MQWEGREASANVEDRRGQGLSTGAVVGGGGGLILVLLALVLGVDPRQFMGRQDPAGAAAGQPEFATPKRSRWPNSPRSSSATPEIVWDEQFRLMGKVYKKPILVLFTDQVESACGRAGAAVGPFYCPGTAGSTSTCRSSRRWKRSWGARRIRPCLRARPRGRTPRPAAARVFGPRGRSPADDERERSTTRCPSGSNSRPTYLAGVWAHHGQQEVQVPGEGGP